MSKPVEAPQVELEFSERPTPIYMIGDSHCLVYRDLLFQEKKHYHRPFITKASYCSGLSASNFTDEHGHINPMIIQSMVKESLLDEKLTAFHLSKSPATHSVSIAAHQALNDPIIVFFCGDIDLRSVFLRQLGQRGDFILPFEVPHLDTFEPIEMPQIIPFPLLKDLALKSLTPLFEGLKHLKSSGFRKLYLHNLPPPTLDDKAFESINGYVSPLLLRYKSTLLFNRLFEEFCQINDVAFLNIWDDVTIQNKLNPAYHLDHVHLNKDAAFIALNRLLNHQLVTMRGPLLHRYEQVHSQALEAFKSSTPIHAKIKEQFAQEHIVILPGVMAREEVSKILDQLEFNLDVGNRHFRLDWLGNTVQPFSSNIMTAKPEEETLKLVFEFMYCETIKEAFHACCQYDYVIPTCRPVMSLPHQEDASGPQSFHRDGGPPGFMRAILYLSDVDEESGAFEYLDSSGQSHLVTGPAGTFFIFDANAIEHRGSPPRSGERKVLDFVILPQIEGVPSYVCWPGMNHWPVDPFQFSIRDYVTYPPFEANILTPQKQISNLSGKQTPEQQLYVELQRLFKNGQFKALMDVFRKNTILIEQMFASKYIQCSYFVGTAYYLLESLDSFVHFVEKYRNIFLSQQLKAVVGPYYKEFLASGDMTGKEQPVNEVRGKRYELIFLSATMTALNCSENLEVSYLFLGDSQQESQMEWLESFSNQYPQQELIFIELEDLQSEEVLCCCQQAEHVYVPQIHIQEMIDLAMIMTSGDGSWGRY